MKNRRGASFVTIMIVVALASLLLRFSIDKVIRMNIEQNESGAQSALKMIAASLENYAKDNRGVFPNSLSILTSAKPHYLDKDYNALSPLKGYNYTCARIEPAGYDCSAIPVECGITGKRVYTVATGGSFVSEDCNKKE